MTSTSSGFSGATGAGCGRSSAVSFSAGVASIGPFYQNHERRSSKNEQNI
jgi:hypothetical protein